MRFFYLPSCKREKTNEFRNFNAQEDRGLSPGHCVIFDRQKFPLVDRVALVSWKETWKRVIVRFIQFYFPPVPVRRDYSILIIAFPSYSNNLAINIHAINRTVTTCKLEFISTGITSKGYNYFEPKRETRAYTFAIPLASHTPDDFDLNRA